MLKAMGAAMDHSLTDSTQNNFLTSSKVSNGGESPSCACERNEEGALWSIGCSSLSGLSISKATMLSFETDDVVEEGEPLLSNAPPPALSVTFSIFENLDPLFG